LHGGVASRCTDGCTSQPSESDSGAANASDAGPVAEHFAEAVAMLERLPLTDAERAKAVRRLLAGVDTDAPAVSTSLLQASPAENAAIRFVDLLVLLTASRPNPPG
jgi:hypothetical protein